MPPKFDHCCKSCEFLGHYDKNDNYPEADLYFCKQLGNIPTVIARFSDEESDYYSGIEGGKLHFRKQDDHPAGVAYGIALAKGLLSFDDLMKGE